MNTHFISHDGTANQSSKIRRVAVGLAWILLAVGCGALDAADTPQGETKALAPRLTERDYLLEELKLAEELLQIEEKRAEQVKGAPEKVISARRSVISLKRQLAAYDERTKRPTPEEQAERKRRAAEEQRKAEARKREADAEADRTRTLKEELLSVLLDVAQEDADAQVRLAAVSSIGRLQLDASIVPVSRIAVKDPDSQVRQHALLHVLSFRNAPSTAVLLGLYDEFADANLKLALLAGLQENLAVTKMFWCAVNGLPWPSSLRNSCKARKRDDFPLAFSPQVTNLSPSLVRGG